MRIWLILRVMTILLHALQEKVFTLGASRVEVTFFTNLLTVFGMVVSTLANGNMFDFIRYAWTNPDAATYMVWVL